MSALPRPGPLVEHRPGVWIKESWLPVSGMKLQTRMTILRLGDGLLVHSPSPPLDEATRAEIDAIGTPRYLLAPNEIHNIGLLSFQAAWPDAHTTGCVGHPRRVPKVRFDLLLDTSSTQADVPWAASGEIAFHVIAGNELLHEVALLHRPTRTLVLTDAIEYVDPHVHVEGAGLVLAMMPRFGLRYGEPIMSPEHNLVCLDPDALQKSFEAIDAWDFDAMILAHGRLTDGAEAREAFRKAFTTTIERVRQRSKPMRGLFGTLAKL